MNSQILISVIIPCYNVQEFIERCVHSIFDNNYDSLELILINDGSLDNTFTILTSLQKYYSEKNLIIINQSNKGLSITRNIGIDIASGEYLMFVDSDDWISKDYFSSFIEKILDVELVIASYTREFLNKSIPRNLNITGVHAAKEIQRRIVGLIDKELSDPSQADSIVTLWSKLYKRSIIKDNHLYLKPIEDIGTAEDLMFNLEYLEFCKKVYCIDKPLYHYRKDNHNSFTNIYKADLYLKWQTLFRHIESIIQVKDVVFHKALSNRICLSIIGLGLNELKNPNGFEMIIRNLKSFVSTSSYENAIRKLELRFFPFHWKLFFQMVKYKFIFGLYLMLVCIRKLITK